MTFFFLKDPLSITILSISLLYLIICRPYIVTVAVQHWIGMCVCVCLSVCHDQFLYKAKYKQLEQEMPPLCKALKTTVDHTVTVSVFLFNDSNTWRFYQRWPDERRYFTCYKVDLPSPMQKALYRILTMLTSVKNQQPVLQLNLNIYLRKSCFIWRHYTFA